jgi:voltage-gated potassium channel
MSRHRHLKRHSRALATLWVAVVLDALGGVAFALVEHRPLGDGLYWALTTATTVGYGDITPHTVAGHLIAIAVMMTVVPLFVAVFSLLTSTLTSTHIEVEGRRTRTRLDHIIHHHPDIPEMPDGTDR